MARSISGTSSPAPIPIPRRCASRRSPPNERRDRRLAPRSCSARCRRTRLAQFAVQHLSRQGSLHVARHGARLWRARPAAHGGPNPFPQNSLLAARVALALDGGEPRRVLTRPVYRAEFAEGTPDRRPPRSWRPLLNEIGVEPRGRAERAHRDGANKERLKAECASSTKASACPARLALSPRTARFSGATIN